MADKKATLIIEVKDLATAGLEKVRGAFDSITQSALGITVSLAGIVAGLVAAFKAFADLETQTNRLNGALTSQGINTKAYSKELQDLAAHVQETTTLSKEAALSTITLLTSFGLAGVELKKANKAVLDLSAGLGIDLRSATMLVAKAWEGQTTTLQRYGIIVNSSQSQSEKFAEAMQKINDKFGGRAEAELNTYSGRIEHLANKFHDLEVSLGGAVAPFADRLITLMGAVAIGAQELSDRFMPPTELETKKKKLEEVTHQIVLLNEAVGLAKNTPSFYEKENKLLAEQKSLIQQIIALKPKSMTGPAGAAGPVGGEPASKVDPEVKFQESLKQMEFQKKLANVQSTGPLGLFTDKNKAAEMEIKLEEQKNSKIYGADKALTLRKQQENKLRSDNIRTTLDFISTLSNSKNKELAAVGKVASTAMATVKTYEAANVALASAPPPFNFALAAAVVVAGLANVATIAGVPMAHGGMVMPSSGGTLATIGEAGSREAVIPLDDQKTKDALRDTFGGGGVTVQVGTLIADQAGLEDFARRLDQVFWRLKKNRQTVAI